MTDNAKDEPVTFEMLLDAIDGCGEAFGQALHIALAEVGANRSQLKAIAQKIDAVAAGSKDAGPGAHCMTAIVSGFLKPFVR